MYDMKDIVVSIDGIPESWIYRYYYSRFAKDKGYPVTEISQNFDGRIIKMRSLFSNDSNPSLCFYPKDGKYLWNDFSRGKGGDALAFVGELLSKYSKVTNLRIITDYNQFTKTEEFNDFIQFNDVKVRTKEFILKSKQWDVDTLKYWGDHKIYRPILERFNVKALRNYKMKDSSMVSAVDYWGPNTYAYYCNDGWYQIYQPYNTGTKYLTIRQDYMMGEEQLKFKAPICLIQSGLKDIMAMASLNINVESVASTSENTLLPKAKIDFLKSKYKFVFSLLDNDKAGIRAMRRYKQVYDVDFVWIQNGKDIAEILRDNSYDYLRTTIPFQLNQKTNEYPQSFDMCV